MAPAELEPFFIHGIIIKVFGMEIRKGFSQKSLPPSTGFRTVTTRSFPDTDLGAKISSRPKMPVQKLGITALRNPP